MQKRSLVFNDAVFAVNDYFTPKIKNLTINPNDIIVLLGGNGSGKTSISKALNQDLKLLSGNIPSHYKSSLVAFEKQIELFNEDFKLRNNDNANDSEALGLTPNKLFSEIKNDELNSFIDFFNIRDLLDKPIRTLSGGEGRKVLIVKALSEHTDLIIFDTPFDALDFKSRGELLKLIEEIPQKYQIPVVLIVNRPQEIPSNLTAIGIIKNLELSSLKSSDEIKKDHDICALINVQNYQEIKLPPPPKKFLVNQFSGEVLVDMKKVNIKYQDKTVFDNLDFKVNRHEHWLITGPNGAGKSTLLSLITGDNPLVYTNDITVFGFKRGQGESIWDIKKYYGVVSGALHLDYRVSAPAINVVLSGFYDSIGLYKQPTDEELKIAKAYLNLAGLLSSQRKSFKQLSFGEQRVLLIIRALVKMPPLLILDEPLQGLDGFARARVLSFISSILKQDNTSILYVTHHKEDIPDGFTNKLSFVKKDDVFDVLQEKI